MAVITLDKGNSNSPGKSIKDIFDEVFGNSRRPGISSPGIASLHEDSRKKVVMIRRQLTHGTYNIDERLNDAIDRIFTDIKP